MIDKVKIVIQYLTILSTFLFPLSVKAEAVNASSASDTAKPVGYQVITHSDVATKSLSLNQLRSIFSLRAKDWSDGTEINLIVLRDDNPHHINFLKKNLSMLPHQLRRQWDRIIYSGKGQGPIVVDSLDEMLEKVTFLKGSIGYVVDKELKNVQILEIN